MSHNPRGDGPDWYAGPGAFLRSDPGHEPPPQSLKDALSELSGEGYVCDACGADVDEPHGTCWRGCGYKYTVPRMGRTP